MLVRVTGESMSPTLHPGDRLLISRMGPARAIPRGAIVVLRREESAPLSAGVSTAVRPRLAAEAMTVDLIKRVVAIPGDPVPAAVRPAVAGARTVPAGKVVVLGDNSKSADSRSWGFVSVTDVLGVVRFKVS